ncbi:MAG TPA: hypothetical protein VFV31_10830 [Chitinophagaceae bacterium]|nr:hypothetical protein [Chitinophagaceae bacterium]
MKKIIIIPAIVFVAIVLTNCSASKKTATAAPVKLTYEANLSVVVMNNCTPCHIPAKGGKKKAYDTYASIKTDIDEIIRRIELNPTDKGFMPFKKTARLSDSTIAVFKQWRTDGLLEK